MQLRLVVFSGWLFTERLPISVIADNLADYCHYCRATYWKRSLATAILAALTAIAVVAYLSSLQADTERNLWLGVGLTSWLFCVPLFFIAGRLDKFFIILGYGLLIYFEYEEGDVRLSGCTGSIFLAVAIYRWLYRNECRACGYRFALNKTETKRHFEPELFLTAGHDEALWRCKHCHHEVWKVIPGSGPGR